MKYIIFIIVVFALDSSISAQSRDIDSMINMSDEEWRNFYEKSKSEGLPSLAFDSIPSEDWKKFHQKFAYDKSIKEVSRWDEFLFLFHNYASQETVLNSVVRLGEKLPDFSFTDMNGNIISRETYPNTVFFINFFFVNCPPCYAEVPLLNELKNKYEGKDIMFLAVSRDDNKIDVQKFAKNAGFELVLCPATEKIPDKKRNNSVNSLTCIRYGLSSFPAVIIIDRDGKVICRSSGYLSNKKEDYRKMYSNAIEQAIRK